MGIVVLLKPWQGSSDVTTIGDWPGERKARAGQGREVRPAAGRCNLGGYGYDLVMNKRKPSENNSSAKPKVSELRSRFEFIKASFAIEGISFTEEELRIFEESIRKRHRGPGLDAAFQSVLSVRKAG